MTTFGLEFRYHIVDVFSDKPLAGNALCVVIDPVPEPVMQAIAREVNLSETTFASVSGDAEYDIRIFTPAQELPFAGHPSLGTAWVLGARSWTQRSEGAVVTVEATDAGAVMSQPDPSFTEREGDDIAAALRLPGAPASFVAEAGGLRHLIVPTEPPIDRLEPDMGATGALAKSLGCPTVAVVRPIGGAELHVRVFAPGAGITEDPGTGSAAGPIGLLARKLWNTSANMTIRQGIEIGRPCEIDVHAIEGEITVGGRISSCAHGVFTL